ncbi:hypothetical protein SISSUDRAFT_1053823 [Sistotremastrum suecicum HHB10207 ss-3]|uniref:Uncharacterized protein n=1 Tax=Sistotremastrum suecicum HHB10207 ss-3 TaxID=1314776 RepID=A0A165YYN1_9AGAM|nr:hypothetical protein SISSUDRAFT_1053823 [Sistotremastrum suecicum HHB10207 ss-3]
MSVTSESDVSNVPEENAEWHDLIQRNPEDAAAASERALHFLRIAEIHEPILNHLNLRDVCAFGQIHRDLRGAPGAHFDSHFNTLLRRFFADAKGFRNILRRLQAVISGSTVLSFISRDPWESRDLDLYCPLGTAHLMCDYLSEVEGYGQPRVVRRSAYSAQQGIGKILRMKKLVDQVVAEGGEATQRQIQIDIIESITTLAVEPITNFHSTAVMNFLYADGVVVLYPDLTFRRISVKSNRPNIKFPPYPKYEQRGYLIVETGYDFLCRTACPVLYRATHDGASMMLRFRDNGTFVPGLAYWRLNPNDGEMDDCLNVSCPKRTFIPIA